KELARRKGKGRRKQKAQNPAEWTTGQNRTTMEPWKKTCPAPPLSPPKEGGEMKHARGTYDLKPGMRRSIHRGTRAKQR
ncbi:hypothetical protein C4U94_19485, partial [Clostridioides difficile]